MPTIRIEIGQDLPESEVAAIVSDLEADFRELDAYVTVED